MNKLSSPPLSLQKYLANPPLSLRLKGFHSTGRSYPR